MRYIDAGYAAALSVLFAYSVTLLARRRRLARLADKVAALRSRDPVETGESASV